jgi:hypothetical protein
MVNEIERANESAHSLHPHPRAQEARQAMSASFLSVYYSQTICVHYLEEVGYRGGVEPINVQE